MRRQSLAYVLPPPQCHPPAVWQCINDLPSQGLSLLMPQGPEFLRYCQLQTAKAWPATNSIASMFCFLNPSFWHGPYNSSSHYFSSIAPLFPTDWQSMQAESMFHISMHYPCNLIWHQAQAGLLKMLVWYMEQSKIARRRRGKSRHHLGSLGSIRAEICTWTFVSMCGHTICVHLDS